MSWFQPHAAVSLGLIRAIDPAGRAAYIRQVAAAVRPAGHVIVAS